MAQQHTFTAAVQVTQNAARVKQVTYQPEEATLTVVFAIGYYDSIGGTFVESEVEIRTVPFANLPASTQTALTDIVNKALSYALNQGIIPAGTVEVV